MADIWTKRVRELELGADVYNEVNDFFLAIEKSKKVEYPDVDESKKKAQQEIDKTEKEDQSEINKDKDLGYREGQHTMALTVAEALKEKQILLIEAQVGIGKSYAYLIPLVYSFKKNPKIKGAVIATSTIALQEQLMKDIAKVVEMLDIDDFEAILVKGKNNYVCEKRVHEFLKEVVDPSYQYILEKIEQEKGKALDRDDFLTLPDSIWKKINVKNCLARACPHYINCQFTLQKEENVARKIVVTNQDYLAQHLKMGNESSLLKNASVLIVDEAHNLEEKVRNSYTETIDKRKIEGALYHLYNSVTFGEEEFYPEQATISLLNHFFVKLRSSAKNSLDRHLEVDSYQDCDRVMINCSPTMKKEIDTLISKLMEAIKVTDQKSKQYEGLSPDKRAVDIIEQFCKLLKDLLKGDKATNLYWVKFLDKKGKYVQLSYVSKETSKLLANSLSRIDGSVVLTSATLSAGDDYQYYADSIGLNQVMGRKVFKEFPITSPYDYANQVLLYTPTDITNPKLDRERFLDDVVYRIRDLFALTEGRSLVLFTSRSDMNYVYEHLGLENFDYPIYLQSDNVDMKKLRESFENNIHSCLLATGTFFEGIDIKGESLSSVIIPRLPFPIVDPVVDFKAKKYQDGFKEVYLPEMMIKLRQATGRLIRSCTDKGIISILDPRFMEYNEMYNQMLTANLPFTTMTSDMDEVRNFVREKLR